MRFLKILLIFIICAVKHVLCDVEFKDSRILISILVRNKAHTLPYFLSNLERLNYPKDRIFLWIRSDHNSDISIYILKTWVNSVKDKYHSIDTECIEDGETFPDEKGPAHWTTERFNHIISLRESALYYARHIWADYLLTIDCDVFLTNRDALHYLISKNFTIVSPMLKSDGLYSNFWYGMTEDFYYERTDQYLPVLNKEEKGCFQVPMVHSCVLIDLRRVESDFLSYLPGKVKDDRKIPNDDIIAFAVGANKSGVALNLCNEEPFGYVMVPLEQDDSLSLDYDQLVNMKLLVLNHEEPMSVGEVLKPFVPKLPQKNTLGFDKIFMINLRRRSERRRRMMMCFDELGLDVTTLEAVDGKALNETFLETIRFMPEYEDPYHKRPMTLGEIGCFMSHFNLWREIVQKGYEKTLILEDDISFEPFFKMKVSIFMSDINKIPNWDLVYFGRKPLQANGEEQWVDGSSVLVEAGYSYWTLGYVLSLRGAQKLLAADPLSRLVPVDEYLPILYDKHPVDSWKGYFPERNLVALSALPLFLYPTHYTGDKGYISDTEDSIQAQEVLSSMREDL